MKSEEALKLIEYVLEQKYYGYENAIKIIKKDLEALECFKKLFEGEDLYGWIEFNFGETDEDSIDNYNGYISLKNKIRKWLNENN